MQKWVYIVKGTLDNEEWVVGIYTSRKRAVNAVARCKATKNANRYYFYQYYLNR